MPLPLFRHGRRPLTCRELVDLVTDYFEDALPADDRRRFEAHIGDCEGCETYLEQMRRTLSLLGSLREEDVTPQAHLDLGLALAELRSRRS